MNFYASSGYLQVVADVYFPGRATRVGDVGIGNRVLRTLIVDDREVVTEVPFLDYHEPLSAGEIAHVERRRAWAPWVVQGIVDCRRQTVAATDQIEPAPFIDWSLFASFDDYLESFNLRHVGRLREKRRQRRRLAEWLGTLDFCFDDRRSDTLGLARRWKSEQLRASGRDDIFADPRNVRFFDMLRDRGLLAASTLRASGRLLAVSLGVVHEGNWSGWILSYDHSPELQKYSPGHQLLHAMLEYGCATGHRQFDFSIGGEPYKWLYATHARILAPLGRRPSNRSTRDVAREVARDLLARSGLQRPAKAIRKIVLAR